MSAAAVVDPEKKQVAPLDAATIVAQEQQKKEAADFRNYATSPHQKRVEHLYSEKYTKMTLEKTLALKAHYGKLAICKQDIWSCCCFLDTIVDESDPDSNVPQTFHMYQTAEACRKAEPDQEWFHLTGLIHDLGKVLAHEKFGALEQYATVGDIYPVGCKFDTSANVLPQFIDGCPDNDKPELRTELGIYEAHCGLSKLHMTFSHDEYLFQVLSQAAPEQMKLPPEALYIIRFHSFYPFHDVKRGAYRQFADEYDMKVGLPLLQKFSRCDLYSKENDESGPTPEVVAYYKGLIEKYLPGVFAW